MLRSLVALLVFTSAAAAQNLIVGSYYNSGVLGYSPTGGGLQQTLIAPTNTPPGPSGLNGPASVIAGPDNFMYVSSQNNNAILRVSPVDGTTTTFINSTTLSAISPSYSPAGLAFGPDGNLYVARNEGNFAFPGTGAIDRFASDGTFLGTLATGLSQPSNLKFHNGELYVSQRIGFNANGYGSVDKFSNFTGTNQTPVNVISTNNALLENPTGIAFDSLNRIYIADVGGSSNGTGCAIRRYDMSVPGGLPAGVSGNPTDAVFAIPDGGGNGSLLFQFPADVLFRDDGKLLVANIGFSNTPNSPFGNVLLYNGSTGVFEQTIATGVFASTMAFSPIPEPGAILFVSGLIALRAIRRRTL
jgi:DNA-binding beta-propeller fold protein YncE